MVVKGLNRYRAKGRCGSNPSEGLISLKLTEGLLLTHWGETPKIVNLMQHSINRKGAGLNFALQSVGALLDETG